MNNLIGQKFGRLIVIKRTDNDKWGHHYWLCQCNCGIKKIIAGGSLNGGLTKSCGCLRTEKTVERSTKHSQSIRTQVTVTYTAWVNMIQRCTNSNRKDYHNYGERGIKICKEWSRFENFLKDMGERPTTRHSIDRIKNDKGYYKENCRWATIKQQNRNKRNNRTIRYKGKTQLMVELAEKFSIDLHVFINRIKLGWSPEKALTEPVKKYKKREK